MPWRAQLAPRLHEKTRRMIAHLTRSQAEAVREIRVRLGNRIEVALENGSLWSDEHCDRADLEALVVALCDRSRYAYEKQMAEGYIPLPGGHRAGVCGRAVTENGRVVRMTEICSVCIRVARDIEGVSEPFRKHIIDAKGQLHSVLVLGPPGCGKTSALRDAARYLSGEMGIQVAVCDERDELFPEDRLKGMCRLDVLSGLEKAQAMIGLIRTMAPQAVIVDEIGKREDVEAILEASRCGVAVLASAHLDGDRDQIEDRPMLKRLMNARAFERYVLLDRHHRCTAILNADGKSLAEGEVQSGQYGVGDERLDRAQRVRNAACKGRAAAHSVGSGDEAQLVEDERYDSV